MRRLERNPPPRRANVSLARALSKLGFCSRSEARRVIADGRIWVNGAVRTDPDCRVDLNRDDIRLDGQKLRPESRVYIMLNKPRGLITTTSDERGRGTVYDCLENHSLPWLAPVGRLDQASEGLLLFTNDNQWASRLLSPESHFDKTYHVQVNCLADESVCRRLIEGASVDGDYLAAKQAGVLRHGVRNSWLRIVLDEGKNRHIRRLLEAFGIEVLRLVRVAIGALELGDLSKGDFRHLTSGEVQALARVRAGRR